MISSLLRFTSFVFHRSWARFDRCPVHVSVHSSRSSVKRESIWNIGSAAVAKFRIWLPLGLGG
jgi:hypothetical protein